MLALFRVVFGGLMLLKLVDVAIRGDEVMPAVAYVSIVVLWALAATGILLGRRTRLAAGLLAVLVLAIVFVPRPTMHSHHLFLILSICVILLMDLDVPLLLRLQLSVVYGFATLAKVNESFLSGAVLHNAVEPGALGSLVPASFPVLAGASALAVLTEGFLAVGFWLARTRRVALWVGVGLHSAMALLMTSSFVVLVQLAVYGGLMLALYLSFFQDEASAWVSSRVAGGAAGEAAMESGRARYRGTGIVGTAGPTQGVREGVPSG